LIDGVGKGKCDGRLLNLLIEVNSEIRFEEIIDIINRKDLIPKILNNSHFSYAMALFHSLVVPRMQM